MLLCVLMPPLLAGCGEEKYAVSIPDTPDTPATQDGSLIQDLYTDTGTSGVLTAGRHRWDAARITVTHSYTISKVTLRMHRIGSPRQNIDVRIYSHNPGLDCPDTMIGIPSAVINASNIPLTENDVTFTGLNSPVTPGTYWLVFYINNYESIYWEDRLNNHVVTVSTNATPRGRTLSYHENPIGADWSEFYDCQVRFVLYGK